jgi:Na+/H+ antiporter NhaC
MHRSDKTLKFFLTEAITTSLAANQITTIMTWQPIFANITKQLQKIRQQRSGMLYCGGVPET